MVVISRVGRDNGGVFMITEMPAFQATDWFIRAMQLMVRAGLDVPPHIFQMGAAGFMTMGLGAVLGGLGKAPYGDVKPLLDELLTCVTTYQPPGAVQPLASWPVIQTQIEEPATILQLHEEIVSLHLGFSLAAKLSNFRTLAASMMAGLMPSTETSSGTSDLPSEVA
jgi:hypothetical protein